MVMPSMEVTMKLGDVPANREVFDAVERAILAEPRDSLLRLLGPRTPGLLVWFYGAGGESRNPREIPEVKVREFVRKYA
jgi:hypothetical protein